MAGRRLFRTLAWVPFALLCGCATTRMVVQAPELSSSETELLQKGVEITAYRTRDGVRRPFFGQARLLDEKTLRFTPHDYGGTVLEYARSDILDLELQKIGSAAQIEAEAATPVLTNPPATPRRWYGREMLALDAVGWALAAVAATQAAGDGDAAEGVVVGGAIEYFVGGAIVHLKHGYTGRAIGSLGLRAIGLALGSALFLTAYPIDFCFDSCSASHEDRPGFAVVAAVAMVGLQVLDNTTAKEPVPYPTAGNLLLQPVPSPEGTGIRVGWVRSF